MCKYCEENINIFDSKKIELKIEKLYDNEYIIEVNYEGNEETSSDYQIINYCPMCGRKLGDD